MPRVTLDTDSEDEADARSSGSGSGADDNNSDSTGSVTSSSTDPETMLPARVDKTPHLSHDQASLGFCAKIVVRRYPTKEACSAIVGMMEPTAVDKDSAAEIARLYQAAGEPIPQPIAVCLQGKPKKAKTDRFYLPVPYFVGEKDLQEFEHFFKKKYDRLLRQSMRHMHEMYLEFVASKKRAKKRKDRQERIRARIREEAAHPRKKARTARRHSPRSSRSSALSPEASGRSSSRQAASSPETSSTAASSGRASRGGGRHERRGTRGGDERGSVK